MRSLVACCFVATLRVYAPTAPYGPDQLIQGFELLIKEFHGISIMKPRVIDERDENGQRLLWLLKGKQQASDRARRARTQERRSDAAPTTLHGQSMPCHRVPWNRTAKVQKRTRTRGGAAM